MAAGIPADRVYVLDVPALGLDAKVNGAAKGPINGAGVDMDGAEGGKRNKTVNELIEYGMTLPEIAAIKWTEGQGSRQTAFILPSSGTGGLPVSLLSFSPPTHASPSLSYSSGTESLVGYVQVKY